MTIEEVIKHAEEVAESQEYEGKKLEESGEKYHDEYENYCASQCFECAKEHRQLAEWLKDYKRLKEQEPCEDAISRQAAIDTIENWLSCDDYNEAERHIMRAMQSVLYDLPSVTPQPKMGHWIMSDDGLYRPICNNCGTHPWKGYIPTVEEATEVFKYCPNCGAKMQEVE